MTDEPPLAPPPASGPPAPDADPGPLSIEPALARATVVMSIGTALSRLSGFVRIAVMAWAVGGTESKLPDTYNLANSMPNIVYQLVIGEVLATVFVPIFVEYIKTRSREEANRLAQTILGVSFIAAGAFAAVTVALAPWLIKIYTFGIEDPTTRALQEQVGTFFLRIFMPQMIFYALGAVLTGLLNAHRRFAAPMFAPVLNNLIVIATFVLFRIKHGSGVPDLTSLTAGDKWLLAGGTTAGVIAMTLVLWPSVIRMRRGYRLGMPNWRHPALARVRTLARYSFGYVAINQFGLWVVYALANGAATAGGITAYNSSWILYQLPYGIFAVSVMTYQVPRLAEHHVAGDIAAVRDDLSLGLRATAFIVLPAAAGFVALGQPIIRLLLEHGVFTAASTELFADTFVLMSVGLGAYAAFQQLMRAFYAMQDTRTPWRVNIVAIIAQIVTAVPLFKLMGVPGLGLAHAISYLAGMITGGAILCRRLGGLGGTRLVRSHVRIAVASLATGAVAWGVARAVGGAVDLTSFSGQLAQVGSAVVAGLVLYVAMARMLRVEELGPIVAALRRTFGRRRG
jgi:putative peptidoglycan lipid II flippase